MRKLLIPSLVSRRGRGARGRRDGDRRALDRRRDGRDPRLRAGLAQPRRGRRPHDRRRQPGVPAVVRRRGEDEAVEGLRPVQRQGLRVRRRVRGRAQLGFTKSAGEVDGRAVQQLVPPGQEAVRLLHHPGLVHARAREGGRLLEVVLLRQPVGRRPQGHADREGASRSPRLKPYKLGAQVGTTSYTYITRLHPAARRARSSTTRTTRPCRR